jgi:hypothetical protein
VIHWTSGSGAASAALWWYSVVVNQSTAYVSMTALAGEGSWESSSGADAGLLVYGLRTECRVSGDGVSPWCA